MPKSSPSDSPPSSAAVLKQPDNPSARMSDVALRKKKNADAQAAFRARRANYIATLEETVTNLESVVLQLQESCRDSRNEIIELRQENSRLRVERREREKFWKTIYNAKKSGRAPEVDDLSTPSLVSSPFMGHAPGTGLPSHSTPVMIHQSYGNGMGYRGEDACQGSYTVPIMNSRYPYPLSREERWHNASSIPSGVSVGDPSTPPHSQSPSYMDSPNLTASSSEMVGYSGRFSGEEHPNSSLNSVLENAPYVFPSNDRFPPTVRDSNVTSSRSMSPTSSTASSSTSIPLTSSFHFAFQGLSSAQERADFDYRRHSLPHCPEVTLHGGTADISLTSSSSDPVRYPIGRRPDSALDHQPMLDNNPEQDQAGSDNDVPQQLRSRRHTIHSLHSQSPSPSPSISCTVAVIKAQAFGALRRTRTRGRKNSQGAAKVAMDVLEARGIGLPTGSKRPRLDDDNIDTETP